MSYDDKIKTQLQYKEHGDFFDDYFSIRKTAFLLLSKSITNPKMIPDLYENVITLIDFTSNYIADISEIDTIVKEIDALMFKKKEKDALIKFRELLRLINKKHEESDVLPQKNVEDANSKFWRNEESKAMKEMKKAFFDVFMKK